MALTTCPVCEGRVSMAAPLCPHCGHPLARKHSDAKTATNLAWFVGVLAVVICAAYLTLTDEGKKLVGLAGKAPQVPAPNPGTLPPSPRTVAQMVPLGPGTVGPFPASDPVSNIPVTIPVANPRPAATASATLFAWNHVQSSWTASRKEMAEIQAAPLRFNRDRDMFNACRGFALRLKGVSRKNVDQELLVEVDRWIGFCDALTENETVQTMGQKLRKFAGEATPFPVLATSLKGRYGVDFPIPSD